MWWHTRGNQISSFARNRRVHLNRPVGVSSVDYWQLRCAPSAVVMLDTPCSEVVWRVLATHCIRQFPLHLPSRASPCAITFQLESNNTLLARVKKQSLACGETVKCRIAYVSRTQHSVTSCINIHTHIHVCRRTVRYGKVVRCVLTAYCNIKCMSKLLCIGFEHWRFRCT